MSDMALKDLRLRARDFFAKACTYSDLNREEFARVNGLSKVTKEAVFPMKLWVRMRHKWVRHYIRPAMHRVFANCKVSNQFSGPKIIEGTGIDGDLFHKAVGKDWQRMRSKLPTGLELVLTTIKKMVEDDVPELDFSAPKIYRKLDIPNKYQAEMYKAIRDARAELNRRRSEQCVVLPPGINAREVPGGYVDLNACVWDFGLGNGCLRKDRFRDDIAEIVWPHLRRALEARQLVLGTIGVRYRKFILASECLSNEVTDVRTATLEKVRLAISKYANLACQLRSVKWGLLQIFAALIEQSESDNSINQKEMSNIYIWLLGLRLPEQESDCYVLSGPEMDAVIDSCIDDIQSGIEFINSEPEWQSMSLIAVAKLNASALIRWGSALVILLMCFTGLRRQSVLNLKLGDWIELRPEVYAIAWKHGKNNYDRVAVLPEVLAKMLNDYVRYLEEPRRALNTDRVFLASDDRGAFCESDGQKLLFNAMANFVKRHKITRGSDPIKLSASILRRTYTTRALSDGRDIWLLRLQLGHKSIKTTMRYAKFERLEHPRQVSDALNTWGRNVLAFWKKPVLLDKLTNEERLHLLNEGESRHVKGGRCRHAGCIKIIAGSPPPCTQCEHLVTGPEFLPEWDIIHVEREKEIKQLKLDDPNGHLLAQKIFQFELFKSNYQYVVGAGVKGVTE